MKRKHMLIFFSMMMILLIFANVFRYQEISKTEATRVYMDRWTGYKWIRMTSSTATNRTPLKYFENPAAFEVGTDAVLLDLTKMTNVERSFTIGWYSLMVVSFAGIAYSLMKPKKKVQA